MNKRVLLAIAGLAIALSFSLRKYSDTESTAKHIGIVIPVEHQAMNDMLQGFTERVQEMSSVPIRIEALNAQGDLNLQQAMIEKLRRDGADIVAGIGTDVTLMAMNRLTQTPVLGLDVTDQVQQTSHPNVTGVRESSIEPSYEYIRTLLPDLKKVAMVYSSSDKNYQMLERFTQLALKDGITIQPIMIQSVAELYILSKTVESDIDAIFIAKDHLVASGATVLAQVADQLGVPLITSDEGSIRAGGTLALGNRETDIGRAAGELTIRLLNGESAHDLPILPTSRMTLFVNPQKVDRAGLTMDDLRRTADRLNYPLQLVQNGGSQ